MEELTCVICGKEYQRYPSRRGAMGDFCGRECYIEGMKDEFTDFRIYIARIKNRGKDFSISLEYLKELWESQDGKCIHSGVALQHPKNRKNSRIYTASLDRIDSNEGYFPGNLQFVSIAINWMKGDMTEKEVFELLDIIRNKGN